MDFASSGGIFSIAILKCLGGRGGEERSLNYAFSFVHFNKNGLPKRRSNVIIFLNTISITKDLLNFYFFFIYAPIIRAS